MSGAVTDFDEFYRANRAKAVRWASALVGDPAIGEELAQEALASVGGKLASVDDPPAYLRHTIVNRAASWHRTHKREQRRLQRSMTGSVESYTQQTNEMLDALRGLPYNQQPCACCSIEALPR